MCPPEADGLGLNLDYAIGELFPETLPQFLNLQSEDDDGDSTYFM